jgi:hypothetical protein
MSKFTMQQDAPASRELLKEQIRQTVRDAQQAAQEAAKEAATAQGRPVIVVPGTPPVTFGTGARSYPPETIPPQVESISIAFFISVAAVIIGLPLMRAIARRIEKGTPVAAPIPAEVRQQLQQITQSVDAIAIEVERISEGQRFTTKMLADKSRETVMIPPGGSSAP